MELSDSMINAIAALHGGLQSSQVPWLVGGSCGLALQGVSIGREPRDLDVYIDEQNVEAAHEAMKEFAIDTPSFSKTPIYESVLSHYDVNGAQTEMVGGFRVRADGADYAVEIGALLAGFRIQALAGGRSIPLMPLAHELLFNMLRKRPDRYEAIAAVMKRNYILHLPPLFAIIRRNRLTPELIDAAGTLLGLQLQERME